MSRPVNIRDIDPSKLGPNSPLLALLRRKPRRDREHDEQVKLFDWALQNEAKYPDLRWLFAVPNWIGVRTAKQGARLKAEGRKVGVLDVWLPVKRGNRPGLVIEMKIQPNRPTKEQREWLEHLGADGWWAGVAYSSQEAEQMITGYLKEDSTP